MTNDWYKNAFYRVSVVGIIRNGRGEILMVNEHNRWTIPGGGWDFHESLHEALKRELFEEIELTSDFTETVVDAVSFFNPNKNAWQMWIACNINYDDLKYGVGEHASGVRWTKETNIDNSTISGGLIERILQNQHSTLSSETKHKDPVLPTLAKGVYCHTKTGNLYEVVGITFHTETNEPLVLYRPLYKSEYEIFARPYDVFTGSIELEGKVLPRFQKIND